HGAALERRRWHAHRTAPEHSGIIEAVAFSPDGKTVLTGGGMGMGQARLWSAADGTAIGQPLKHSLGVEAVAFSPDGKTILTGVVAAARLWPVPRPIPGEPQRIELWTQVITGMELNELDVIRFLDAKTWQERRRLLRELGGPPMP